MVAEPPSSAGARRHLPESPAPYRTISHGWAFRSEWGGLDIVGGHGRIPGGEQVVERAIQPKLADAPRFLVLSMKRVVTGSRRPAQYKIGNWAEYDAALRRRGSLTVWVTPEAATSLLSGNTCLDCCPMTPARTDPEERRFPEQSCFITRTIYGYRRLFGACSTGHSPHFRHLERPSSQD